MHAKKAVFVDFRSLSETMRGLGVPLVNLKELIRIIRHQVGDCAELSERPLITISPADTVKGRKFHHKLQTLGYNVVPVTADDEEDDRVIIAAIQAVDVSVVKEIVIVSSDSDYISALREKKREGLQKVFFFTHDVVNQQGCPSIGGVLRAALDSKEFHEVDLSEYKEALTYTKLPSPVSKAPSAKNGNGNGAHEPETANIASPHFVIDPADAGLDVSLINYMLVELPERFPGIKVRMEE